MEIENLTVRLAACGLIRTRFEGRAALTREARFGGLALSRLEARLGLAEPSAAIVAADADDAAQAACRAAVAGAPSGAALETAVAHGAIAVAYCPTAPARGTVRNGGAFRRPRNVHVCAVWPTAQRIARIDSRSVLAATQVAASVDSRYSGPRSAYGAACATADARLAALARPAVAALLAVITGAPTGAP
jgi:hypothetical protein